MPTHGAIHCIENKFFLSSIRIYIATIIKIISPAIVRQVNCKIKLVTKKTIETYDKKAKSTVFIYYDNKNNIISRYDNN
jgi:hypothetical protein